MVTGYLFVKYSLLAISTLLPHDISTKHWGRRERLFHFSRERRKLLNGKLDVIEEKRRNSEEKDVIQEQNRM